MNQFLFSILLKIVLILFGNSYIKGVILENFKLDIKIFY